jgi:hypothetical protein
MKPQCVRQLRKGEEVRYEKRTYVVITDWISSDCNRVCLRQSGSSRPKDNFSVDVKNPWWEKVELDRRLKWKRDRPFVMYFTEYADCWQGYTKHPHAVEPLFSRGKTREEAEDRLIRGIVELHWMLPLYEITEHKTHRTAPHQ